MFNAVTSQRSSGSISTTYSKYAIALTNSKNHDERQIALRSLSDNLRDKTPSYEEFKASFEGVTYTSKYTKHKNLVKYTLKKQLGDSNHGLSIDYDTMTIEHLLPEAEIRSDNDALVIGSIGNLILVDSKTNSEVLASLPYSRKLEILKEKNYPLDSSLLQKEWSKEQINARTEKIVSEAYRKSKIR